VFGDPKVQVQSFTPVPNWKKGCQLRGNLITDTTNGIFNFLFAHSIGLQHQLSSGGITGLHRYNKVSIKINVGIRLRNRKIESSASRCTGMADLEIKK